MEPAGWGSDDSALDHDGHSDWVGRVVSAGHNLEDSLTDPVRLHEVAQALAEIAESTGARMITGASPLGNQLAGLVAGHAATPLALWGQNGAFGTVLIVEGVLASGAQLTQTARRARRAGAERVVGAAVVAEPNGLALCRQELGDEVHALGGLALAP